MIFARRDANSFNVKLVVNARPACAPPSGTARAVTRAAATQPATNRFDVMDPSECRPLGHRKKRGVQVNRTPEDSRFIAPSKAWGRKSLIQATPSLRRR